MKFPFISLRKHLNMMSLKNLEIWEQQMQLREKDKIIKTLNKENEELDKELEDMSNRNAELSIKLTVSEGKLLRVQKYVEIVEGREI